MTQSIRDLTMPASNRAPTPNVAELAQQRLRESPYLALRKVNCRFHEGVLLLTGEVPTYYTKQVAQTLVKGLDHVVVIDNRLIVTPFKNLPGDD
jgi:hypothetical protein